MRSPIQFFILILAVSLLTACAPLAQPTQSPAEVQLSAPTAFAVPTITLEVTNSLPPSEPTLESTGTPELVSTATHETLQLFFPTVIPQEGAEYRPPLYPIPWSLSPNDHFYFSRPIGAKYPAVTDIGYLYGGLYFSPDAAHSGIDIPAPRGAEVLAAAPGTVVWAGFGLYSGSQNNTQDPYGLAVAIRHDFGYQNQSLFTVYAHMDEIDVIIGQQLATGEVVGNVGTTGLTTGPHLHFEVRLGENDFWETRNPDLWIAPPLGYGVLAGRVMKTSGQLLESYQFMVTSLATKQNYVIKTYAPLTVNSDVFYQENIVLGDLPAGTYEINMPYGAYNRKVNIDILPGRISYFTFTGYNGFTIGPPPPQTTIP